MKTKTGKYLVPFLGAGMLIFATYHVVETHQSLPQPPPPLDPPRAAFGRTVAGTGIVEPETENISIGSALPGTVLEAYVPVEKAGQLVTKADPPFLLNNRQLPAQLTHHHPSTP